MKERYLEAGKIINTHGVRGELKVEPWCDTPEFLLQFKRVVAGDAMRKVLSSRVHQQFVLMTLEGIEDMSAALRFKNKVIRIDREDITLPDGTVFVQDLIGLPVFDERSEREIGVLDAIENMPAQDVYVVRDIDVLYRIPAVKPFLVSVDEEKGIVVHTIEGMLDAN